MRKYARDMVDAELYGILTDVERYVQRGAFTQANPEEYRKFYNLRLANVREGAEALDISSNSFNQRRGRYSRELYKIFGDDFFALVYDADGAEKIKDRLVNAGDTRSSREVVLPEVLSQVRGKFLERGYFLSDCQEEIKFLTRFSKKELEDHREKIDPRKLTYLIALMDKNVKDLSERSALYDLVESGDVGKIETEFSLIAGEKANG